MTVKKLKELLNECDDNSEVIMSEDPEGNHYWTVDDIGINSDYDEKHTCIYPGIIIQKLELL